MTRVLHAANMIKPGMTVWIKNRRTRVYHLNRGCRYARQANRESNVETERAWGRTACSYCKTGARLPQAGWRKRQTAASCPPCELDFSSIAACLKHGVENEHQIRITPPANRKEKT